MQNLALTTDDLSLTQSAAGTLDIIFSHVDVDTATGNVFTPGKTLTAMTTATTSNVVTHPGAGLIRNIKTGSIRNKHASQSTDVTLNYDANGTLFEIIKCTLLPGETLLYNEGTFFHYDNNAGVYSAVAQVADPNVIIKSLLADQSNSTVTPTNVAGLEVAMGVGKWAFEYFIRYQAAAATTGVRFDVNHDGTVTSFVWNQEWVASINTTSSDAPDQDMIAALGGVVSGFASRAKGTAGRGTTLSVDTLNADMYMRIQGMCEVTVAGNLELWHGSEVAAASTVKQGTTLVAFKGR